MYKILLVDDEPLILAGLKSLLNWKDENCNLLESARNGEEALKAIDNNIPDIVITDINMPVMDGLELLEKVEEKYPTIVFVVLSNIEEFELVRKAMRLKAIDYLLKTNISKETLVNILKNAMKEVDKRKFLIDKNNFENKNEIDVNEMIDYTVSSFIYSRKLCEKTSNIIEKVNIYNNYCLLEIKFLQLDIEETNEISTLVNETTKKMLNYCFSKNIIVKNEENSIIVFLWEEDKNKYKENINVFYNKLATVVKNIFGAKIAILSSSVLNDIDDRKEMLKQIDILKSHYYYFEKNILLYNSTLNIETVNLNLVNVFFELQDKLSFRKSDCCVKTINEIIEILKNTYHTKNDGIRVCEQLYYIGSKTLEIGDSENYFSKKDLVFEEIKKLDTHTKVISWIEKFKNEVVGILEPMPFNKVVLLESVKEYVIENIDKRITLQEAADHVYMSPAYLSTLFKKEYNQSFVDFVNESKTKRACELIKDNKLKINEISYILSFENAYYFSKVFKKYTGLTPTEYRCKYFKHTK